jgi:hypothetical protein
LIMFSNIELGRLSRPTKAPKPIASNGSSKPTDEKGLVEQPRMSTIVSALENGLRAVSILFIWIAMQAPGVSTNVRLRSGCWVLTSLYSLWCFTG